MKYISTRSQSKALSFTDTLLEGLAPDGGLYIPESLPAFTEDDLHSFQTLNYAELALKVISVFVGESIPQKDLKNMLINIYSPQVFNSSKIAPIVPLMGSLYLQDLSSGPSLAFKDMAMQFLGPVLDYILTQRKERLCIVGASSGDTVSAAEEALKSKSNIDVVMLTPKEGMSPFQKAQAGSILDSNIYNLSIPGTFDDCQDIVKEINRDLAFKTKHSIGAVNSINWGRICAQIVYYVSAFVQLSKNGETEMDISVPTGNFGNILAGYYAKKLGIPIRRLLVATNENKVLDEFIKTGIYEQKDVSITSSPSMDISKASNLERLIYDLLDQDSKKLAEVFKEFETHKRIDLSDHLPKLQEIGFYSDPSTHEERKEVIQQVYDQTGIIIDPHTAAGVKAAMIYEKDETPIVCMETAKPTKFEHTVEEAVGFVPDRPVDFKELENKEQRFYDVSKSADAVKAFIEDKKQRDA